MTRSGFLKFGDTFFAALFLDGATGVKGATFGRVRRVGEIAFDKKMFLF